MQFDIQAQQSLYDKVAKWTGELFGEFIVVRKDLPAIDFCSGPMAGRIAVGLLRYTDAPYVSITCLVADAEEVGLTPEVMRYLLERNERLCMGALSVNQSGQILFGHSIYGDTSTKDDYKSIVKAVLAGAFTAREMLLSGSVGAPGILRLSEPEVQIH